MISPNAYQGGAYTKAISPSVYNHIKSKDMTYKISQAKGADYK